MAVKPVPAGSGQVVVFQSPLIVHPYIISKQTAVPNLCITLTIFILIQFRIQLIHSLANWSRHFLDKLELGTYPSKSIIEKASQ